MSRYQAEKAAKQLIINGCMHHSYEHEKKLHNYIFNCEQDEINAMLESPSYFELFSLYADTLGSNRLRGAKNSVICILTQISRVAIELGVDAEFSFALSDYYIKETEKLTTEKDVFSFMKEIILHYYALSQEERMNQYSQPISRVIRYINRNIYEAITINQVADYHSINPHYLSSLFHQEVGMTPSQYIRQRKMEEAKRMLTLSGFSIAEVSDLLGYCDISHFSRVFKAYYGVCPSSMHKVNS
jgi:AraC-like DNA-binding protein